MSKVRLLISILMIVPVIVILIVVIIVIVLARRDSETAKYSRSAQMLSLTFPTERVQTIIIMHMALEPGGIICTINGNKLLQTRKSVLFWINIFLLMQSPQCSRD